jgi:zinc transport system substrate-binding protein
MAKTILVGAAMAALLLTPTALAADDDLAVTVTIRPVHALVERLMEGVGEPRLLVTGGASPHSYALKPSDARALAESDLVIRVSPALEVTLNAALANLPENAKTISLHETPGLTLLPAREGGLWEAHDHAGHGHDHDHGHDHGHKHDHEHDHAHDRGADLAAGDHDAHFWLDPHNAKAMARHIAESLAGLSPRNKAVFEANLEKLGADLDALDTELAAATKPVAERPYIVFHDAYQYFENRYGLKAAGSVTVSPDRQPSARRIRDLRARIGQAGAVCVFAEPQFEPRLIETIVEGSGAHTGILDPEGTGMPEGADGYFDLMRGLSKNLADCLEKADG